MKAKKHYESGAVIVYAHEDERGGLPSLDICLTFDNEQQMRRLGECLKDLARTGGSEVEVKYFPCKPATLKSGYCEGKWFATAKENVCYCKQKVLLLQT